MAVTNQKSKRRKGNPRRLRTHLLLVAVVLMGFGASVARFGLPLQTPVEGHVLVRELTVPALPFEKWTYGNGDGMVVLPGLHLTHSVDGRLKQHKFDVLAQTSSGLSVQLKNIVLATRVPRHGAIELLKTLGPDPEVPKDYIRAILTVAVRAVLSDTPDALTGATIRLEQITDNIRDAIGPPLAAAGIALIKLELGHLRFDPELEELVTRLNAARARQAAADKASVRHELAHDEALSRLRTTHKQRLAQLNAEYEPLLQGASTSAESAIAAAEHDYQQSHFQAEVRRRVKQIHFDALEYAIRRDADGLKARIKATAGQPSSLVDLRRLQNRQRPKNNRRSPTVSPKSEGK